MPHLRTPILFAALLLSVGVASPGSAQTWNEIGDAGQDLVTAQATVGTGNLTQINGTLSSATDVDMYCMVIGPAVDLFANPMLNLQCVTNNGPHLWVFDANGVGLGLNETCQAGNKTLTNNLIPTSVTTIYIAVAYDGMEPVAAGGSIWQTGVPGERAPDGVDPASPLVGWVGTPNVQPLNPYTITLGSVGVSASHCEAPGGHGVGELGRDQGVVPLTDPFRWTRSMSSRIPAVPLLLLFLAVQGSLATPARGSVPAETVEHLRLQISLRRYAAVADTLPPFLRRARAAGDSLRWGQLLCLEGQAALGTGQVDRSLDLLERSRELAIAQRDTLTWMTTLGVGAFALNRQGRYEEGIDFATRQIALARASGDPLGEAYAQWSLAYAQLQRNQLEAARAAYRRAGTIFGERGQVREELTTLVGLGRVETRAGELDEARRTYGRVMRLAGDLDDAANLADALNNLGAIEVELGRRDLAARYALRAYDVQARRGAGRAQRSVILANLLGFHARSLPEDRIPVLLAELRTLCSEAEADGDWESYVNGTRGLAEYFLRQDRRGRAAEHFDRVAEVATAGVDREMAVILASIARRSEVPPGELLRRLDEEIPRHQVVDPSLRSRVYAERVFLLNRLGRTDEALVESGEYLPHLGQSMADAYSLSGWALALARSGRIRESLTALEGSIAIVEARWERSEELASRWETLSAHRQHIVEAAAELLLAAGGLREFVEPVFQLLQRLKARSLLWELGFAGETDLVGVVDLETIRTQVLAEDEVFLDYSLGYDHAIVLGVSPDADIVHVFSGRAGEIREVAGLLTEWIVPASGTPSTNPDAIADRAYDLVLSPVEGILAGADRVSISPDGVLAAVPFGVLLDRVGRASSVPPRYERVPGIAFRFRDAGSTKTGHVSTVAGRNPDLPGIQVEIASIGSRFARVRHLRGFTEGWADSLRGAAVVHVAAHAEVDGWQPWRSGFRLDAPVDANQDGLLEPTHLRVADLVGTRLDVGLAVLSACESGVGLLSHGEGVLGLSTASLVAPCQAVVSTLWPVDDEVTVDFMEQFYDHLQDGASVSEAVRSAQLAIRGRAETAHPYYWAGFVAVGDGDLMLALPGRDSSRAPLVWGLLGLSGLVAFLVASRRPNRSGV